MQPKMALTGSVKQSKVYQSVSNRNLREMAVKMTQMKMKKVKKNMRSFLKSLKIARGQSKE